MIRFVYYITRSNYKIPLVLVFPKCGLPFCAFNNTGEVKNYVLISIIFGFLIKLKFLISLVITRLQEGIGGAGEILPPPGDDLLKRAGQKGCQGAGGDSGH